MLNMAKISMKLYKILIINMVLFLKWILLNFNKFIMNYCIDYISVSSNLIKKKKKGMNEQWNCWSIEYIIFNQLKFLENGFHMKNIVLL